MNEKTKFDDFFERLTKITPIKNQVQLAKELGISRAAISVAKQKDTIPSKWIFELSTRYGINPSYLISGEGLPYMEDGGEQNTVFVEPVKVEESTLAENTLTIKIAGWDRKVPDKGYFYFQIMENSMEPHLVPGDFLIIERSNLLKIGGIYVFETMLDENLCLFVRRVSLGEKGLILVADNDNYPILPYNKEQIKIIGRVVGFFRMSKI